MRSDHVRTTDWDKGNSQHRTVLPPETLKVIYLHFGRDKDPLLSWDERQERLTPNELVPLWITSPCLHLISNFTPWSGRFEMRLPSRQVGYVRKFEFPPTELIFLFPLRAHFVTTLLFQLNVWRRVVFFLAWILSYVHHDEVHFVVFLWGLFSRGNERKSWPLACFLVFFLPLWNSTDGTFYLHPLDCHLGNWHGAYARSFVPFDGV